MNRTFSIIALQSAVAAAIIAIAPLASAGQMAASVHTSTDQAQDPTRLPFVSKTSRAQVHAEAGEATRLGVTTGTESRREATPAQLAQIRSAGLRAANSDTVALGR